MIVAVPASPIVDKNAVVADLARRRGLTIVPDPGREACRRYGFQTIYEMPEELQRTVRTALLEDHVKILADADSIVLEVSLFEMLADWMRWFWGRTPTATWDRLWSSATEAARRHTAIVHLATGPARGYDGYAWLDPHNARQQEALLRFLYRELGVDDRLRAASEI